MRIALAVESSLATVEKWFRTRGVGMNRAIAAKIEAEANRLGLVTSVKEVA